MKNLAIIPARGGSKRIPRKNIKDFLGKPIIAYSIEAAIDSGLFEEVMVSTDDSEIAEIAAKYGAKIPFLRSEKTSNDFAGTTDVLIEVINNYLHLNKHFNYSCCIYPTAPLVQISNLKKAYKLIDDDVYDTVMTVSEFSYPIQRALKIDNKGLIQYFFPENANKRSQDLDKSYFDAGQFYFFKVDQLLVNKKLKSGRVGYVELDQTLAQDIDNFSDWAIAEMKYKLLNNIL